MLKIGCHLSFAKGFLNMGKEAVKIGANTFQFFTRSPRGGQAKELNLEDIAAYLNFAKEHEITQILAHAPYTLNSCAKEEGLRQFAYHTMCDDLERLEHIPEAMYNFHPGSHVKQGTEIGISYISDMLNKINEKGYSTMILLETMSGKGSEIGRNFQELREIINQVENSSHLGVCLDTCHIFDGGYDIVHGLEQVLEELNQLLGKKDTASAIAWFLNVIDKMELEYPVQNKQEELEILVSSVNVERLSNFPVQLEAKDLREMYQEILKTSDTLE